MHPLRRIAFIYCLILALVTSLNYIPGVRQPDGTVFGVFALDLFDDALHAASALWAGIAAWLSARASRLYLTIFGSLYLADGLMGLALGSGYLDGGILVNGIVQMPLTIKILANLPHLSLGGFALFAGTVLARRWPPA
jgi:hypothetical protein